MHIGEKMNEKVIRVEGCFEQYGSALPEKEIYTDMALKLGKTIMAEHGIEYIAEPGYVTYVCSVNTAFVPSKDKDAKKSAVDWSKYDL